MAIYAIDAPGASAIINGALFIDALNVNSGTGGYEPFLTVGDNDGNAAGFNAASGDITAPDSNPDVTFAESRTHEVLLSELPIVVREVPEGSGNYAEFYEIRLDLNEPGQGGSRVSLDALQVYITSTPGFTELEEVQTGELVYDLDDGEDNTVLLDELSTGSGTDDYVILLPVANFVSADPSLTPLNTYLHMYVELGNYVAAGPTDFSYAEGGGFEEFSHGGAVTISGVKFDDANGDGLWNNEEATLDGVTIYIDDNLNGKLDDWERATTTDGSGVYTFYGVATGELGGEPLDLHIREVVPAGWTRTTGDYEIATITEAGQIIEVDPIGNQQIQGAAFTVTKVADKDSVSTAGTSISYLITVTNTGGVDLTGIVIDDPLVGTLTLFGGDDDNDQELDVGETWQLTGEYKVTQADLDNKGGGDGDIDNTVTVSTNELDDKSASDVVLLTYDPSLAIAKSADLTVVSAAGTIITYAITVTNDGNVTLTGVAVTDAMLADLAFDSSDLDDDALLEVGETWTYIGTYEVTAEDLATNGGGDGDIDNIAWAGSNETDDASAAESVLIEKQEETPRGSINADKWVTHIDGGEGDATTYVYHAGEKIHYAMTVRNNGETDVHGVDIDDPLVTDETYVSGDTDTDLVLDVGEVWTYHATYVVTQEDIDANGGEPLDLEGYITNTVTFSADNAASASASVNTYVDRRPVIWLTKEADVASVDDDDDVINYTVKVQNGGHVSLTGVEVDDPMVTLAYASGDTDDDGALDVDETWTYTGTYDVTEEDIESHGDGDWTIENVASAWSDEAEKQYAAAYVHIDDDEGGDHHEDDGEDDEEGGDDDIPGDDHGDDEGDDDQEDDDQEDDEEGGDDIPGDDNVPGDDVPGDDEEGDDEEGGDRHDGSINVDKWTTHVTDAEGENFTYVYKAGQTITYQMSVRNTGDETLEDVVMSDPLTDDATEKYLSGDDDDDGKLDVGEVWIYEGQYTVTQEDIDSNGGGDGYIENTVTFSADYVEPKSATVNTFVDQRGVIWLTKEADVSHVDEEGDAIQYTVKVQNGGHVSLTDVQVDDPMVTLTRTGGDTDGDDQLDVGETWTYTGTYHVTEADIDSYGGGDWTLENVATASAAEAETQHAAAYVDILTEWHEDGENGDGEDGEDGEHCVPACLDALLDDCFGDSWDDSIDDGERAALEKLVSWIGHKVGGDESSDDAWNDDAYSMLTNCLCDLPAIEVVDQIPT